MDSQTTEVALDRTPFSGSHDRPRSTPVFTSPNGRRDRAVRVGACVLGALTLIWLAALVAGALGMGRLPGVPLPDVGRIGSKDADPGAAPRQARSGTGSHKGPEAEQSSQGPLARTAGKSRRPGRGATAGPRHQATGREQSGPPNPVRSHTPTVQLGVRTPASSSAPQPAPVATAPGTPTAVTPGKSGAAPGASHRPSADTALGSAPATGKKDPPPAAPVRRLPRLGAGS